MSREFDRIWIGISYEQYRGIYDAMGGDGRATECWWELDLLAIGSAS